MKKNHYIDFEGNKIEVISQGEKLYYKIADIAKAIDKGNSVTYWFKAGWFKGKDCLIGDIIKYTDILGLQIIARRSHAKNNDSFVKWVESLLTTYTTTTKGNNDELSNIKTTHDGFQYNERVDGYKVILTKSQLVDLANMSKIKKDNEYLTNTNKEQEEIIKELHRANAALNAKIQEVEANISWLKLEMNSFEWLANKKKKASII